MLYDILKTFKGSPDGRFAVDYIAGTQADLSDTLAPVAIKEGWARPVIVMSETRKLEVHEIANKAVVSDGSHKQAMKRKAK